MVRIHHVGPDQHLGLRRHGADCRALGLDHVRIGVGHVQSGSSARFARAACACFVVRKQDAARETPEEFGDVVRRARKMPGEFRCGKAGRILVPAYDRRHVSVHGYAGPLRNPAAGRKRNLHAAAAFRRPRRARRREYDVTPFLVHRAGRRIADCDRSPFPMEKRRGRNLLERNPPDLGPSGTERPYADP